MSSVEGWPSVDQIADRLRDEARLYHLSRFDVRLISETIATLFAPHLERLDRYRDALEEITSPPDPSRGEYYGCADLHEARATASEALEGEPEANG